MLSYTSCHKVERVLSRWPCKNTVFTSVRLRPETSRGGASAGARANRALAVAGGSLNEMAAAVNVKWITNSLATALNAAAILVERGSLVDPRLAAAVTPAATELTDLLAAAGLPAAKFFEQAIPLTTHTGDPRKLTEMACQRAAAAPLADDHMARIADCLVALDSGLLRQWPRCDSPARTACDPPPRAMGSSRPRAARSHRASNQSRNPCRAGGRDPASPSAGRRRPSALGLQLPTDGNCAR